MSGVGSILNIGQGALNVSQAAIQTTGNNISNVNTVGYSRQAVAIKERISLNGAPGQMGQGVKATEVFRYFDRFIESAYLEKNASQQRYQAEYKMLSSVETLFNESITNGIGSAMTKLFSAFNTLAQEPNSQPVREALVQTSVTLTTTINAAQRNMEDIRLQMDSLIRQDVDKANQLIKDIATLNREINACTINHRNNANAMMDERDLKVRELSSILDINIQDNGAGDYTVSTGMGYLLVQKDVAFSLQFGGQQVDKNLAPESLYQGTVDFKGNDGYEYTIEVVSPGTVDNTGNVIPIAPDGTTTPPGIATYRVSLDGGRTWVTNPDGTPKLFTATDKDHSTQIKDLQIFFTDTGSSLTAGDKFVVSPKNDVFWVTPTNKPINISSQVFSNGVESDLRITGGSLGGNLIFRDYELGQYMDRLDALAESIIWEVNQIHSQGIGIEKVSSMLGTQQVVRPDVPLGSLSSLLPASQRLQAGNVSFAIYDKQTGQPVIDYPGLEIFSPINFDPKQHSLHEVVNAINNNPQNTGYIQADIVDGRLFLTAGEGYDFGIVSDTTGLAAALGINTFFTGTDAFTMEVHPDLAHNPSLVNAGRINGAGEGNKGDNITAADLAALATKLVTINTFGTKNAPQSLTDYYGTIVTKVGAETSAARYNLGVQSAMAQEYSDRQEEVKGVSLDEEMTALIKFQSSYKAAAKLITTADQMLQTLLSLKQ